MIKDAVLTKSVREIPRPVNPKSMLAERIRSKLIVASVIALCMVGVIAISLKFLIHKSLRLDEAQSLWQSSHSVEGILRVVAVDVHVPLYHYLLHFWQLYFGQSIATARVMSLVLFLMTIPMVYFVARQILSRNWSLFVIVLFSFSPFMNWYANEARMYTLLVFVTTCSLYFLMRITQGRKGWLGYLLFALIGVYCHYFFLFTLATHGLYILINRKRLPPKTLPKFIAVGVVAFLELLPWLLYFKSMGAGSTERPLLTRPSSIDFFNAFSQFVVGFQTDHINTILVSCWPLLMLVAFFAVQRNQKTNPRLTLMAVVTFVPVVLAFVLSFVVTPFFLSRYLASAVAPLMIILVWLISRYHNRFSRVVAVLFIAIIMVASLQQNTSEATPVNEDYRAVVADIAKTSQPNDVIALSAPFTVYPFEYYYNGTATIQTLPPWNREATGAIPAFDKNTLPAQVDALKKDHRYIYLVLSQDQGYESQISDYFRDHFQRISVKTYSPGLTMYVYKVGYYTVPSLQNSPPPRNL